MRYPTTPDCAIRDCTRAAGRSTLCTKHQRLVPVEWGMDLAAACMVAATQLAREHHDAWATHVQSRIDNGDVEPINKASGYLGHAARAAVALGRSC